MNSTIKTVLFWLVIGVSALLLREVMKSARDGQKDQQVNVTQFMRVVDQNNMGEIQVNGMGVRGKHRDGTQFHNTAPTNYVTPEMLKSLYDKGVRIDRLTDFAPTQARSDSSVSGFLLASVFISVS